MKTLATCLLIYISFIACKKDASYPEITGIVINQTGAGANSYLVEIENPGNQVSYSFFCENLVPLPPIGNYNCRNSVFITNLPSSLRVSNTVIVFSKYRNLGANPIWSSTHVPKDVEVYDVREK